MFRGLVGIVYLKKNINGKVPGNEGIGWAMINIRAEELENTLYMDYRTEKTTLQVVIVKFGVGGHEYRRITLETARVLSSIASAAQDPHVVGLLSIFHHTEFDICLPGCSINGIDDRKRMTQ